MYDNTQKYNNVAGVSAKTAKRYFKNVEGQVDFRAKFGAIYSASKTKEHLVKKSLAIGFCFKDKYTLELLVLKIRTGGSYLRATYF